MFKVSKAKEAIEESSGSQYIAKSGIYDVVINFASVATSSGGAKSINFNVTWEGNEQVFYGPYVVNKNGDTNEIGAKLINKLAIIAGMEDGDEFEVETETHNVGKDQKPTDLEVIQQFSDLPVKMRVQEVYSSYNGEIRKQMEIKSFFNEDGASAEELVNGSEVGVRLALEESKYADHITYRDDLTEEDVAAWKESKRNGSDAPAKAPAPKAKSSGTKERKLFGQ